MILNADVLDGLAALPDGLAQCVVTSPPYYGLRDYGVPPTTWPDGWVGCLGLEPTPQLYLDHLVLVLAEVCRVLRDDGVLWLNIGDSYYDNGRGPEGEASTFKGSRRSQEESRKPPRRHGERQMRGNKLGIPERLVLALQADGCVWRQTVIWSKPNPLPESVRGWRWERCRKRVGPQEQKAGVKPGRINPSQGSFNDRYSGKGGWAEFDPCPGCPKCEANDGLVLRRGSWRPTTAHEYLYMLTRGPAYFGDGEAVREAAEYGRRDTKGAWRGGAYVNQRGAQDNSTGGGLSNSVTGRHPETGRNPRSVWTIPTQPFPEAHFATFPERLVEPCVLSSTPERCCSECGAAWAPVVERFDNTNRREPHRQGRQDAPTKTDSTGWKPTTGQVLDYRPTCACTADHRPAVVLDPFAGAGTVGLVAERLGRRFVGLELSTAYAAMAWRRIAAGTEQLQLGL